MLINNSNGLTRGEPLLERGPQLYVRRGDRSDLPAIVQLHTISQLPCLGILPGPAFLRDFYSFVLRDAHGLLLVSQQNGDLAGFLVGSSDRRFPDDVVATRRLPFLATAARCILRHPLQLSRFLHDVHATCRFKRPRDQSESQAWEMIAIAVQPQLRGHGHGKSLVLAFVEAARSNDRTHVRVCIDSNDIGMSCFYRRLGFEPSRTFKAEDAQWNDEYVLRIQRG
jgi:ribosomal protein S18 acetylase RimI-like enzyme